MYVPAFTAFFGAVLISYSLLRILLPKNAVFRWFSFITVLTVVLTGFFGYPMWKNNEANQAFLKFSQSDLAVKGQLAEGAALALQVAKTTPVCDDFCRRYLLSNRFGTLSYLASYPSESMPTLPGSAFTFGWKESPQASCGYQNSPLFTSSSFQGAELMSAERQFQCIALIDNPETADVFVLQRDARLDVPANMLIKTDEVFLKRGSDVEKVYQNSTTHHKALVVPLIFASNVGYGLEVSIRLIPKTKSQYLFGLERSQEAEALFSKVFPEDYDLANTTINIPQEHQQRFAAIIEYLDVIHDETLRIVTSPVTQNETENALLQSFFSVLNDARGGFDTTKYANIFAAYFRNPTIVISDHAIISLKNIDDNTALSVMHAIFERIVEDPQTISIVDVRRITSRFSSLNVNAFRSVENEIGTLIAKDETRFAIANILPALGRDGTHHQNRLMTALTREVDGPRRHSVLKKIWFGLCQIGDDLELEFWEINSLLEQAERPLVKIVGANWRAVRGLQRIGLTPGEIRKTLNYDSLSDSNRVNIDSSLNGYRQNVPLDPKKNVKGCGS